MNTIRLLAVGAVVALAGCEAQPISTGSSGGATYAPLPEQVLAIAAPNQNLSAARLDPSDGCYWYRYAGPVETTWLPLRTVQGNPICTRQPDI
ncbi:hypothetical protein MWU54_11700 [Marivita sp. S6314]|uniref:hypothetical protein n=1 Tax=Marivita sp. S6314 TaxID=2926406 RepID=UPI001FF39FC9|nr:hypothetical protein [Marivita sp. S6314]MCK0150692.1 hypothetical protein [Marivita sp. S6314]